MYCKITVGIPSQNLGGENVSACHYSLTGQRVEARMDGVADLGELVDGRRFAMCSFCV